MARHTASPLGHRARHREPIGHGSRQGRAGQSVDSRQGTREPTRAGQGTGARAHGASPLGHSAGHGRTRQGRAVASRLAAHGMPSRARCGRAGHGGYTASPLGHREPLGHPCEPTKGSRTGKGTASPLGHREPHRTASQPHPVTGTAVGSGTGRNRTTRLSNIA